MEHNTTWSSKNMRILKQKLAIGLKITIVFFFSNLFSIQLQTRHDDLHLSLLLQIAFVSLKAFWISFV